VLAAAAFAVPHASASTAQKQKGVTLGGHPLGVNVAPWEWADLASSSRHRMDGYLKQLDPVLAVRYGGGAFADADNQLIGRNTYAAAAAGHQTSNFRGPGAKPDALTFPVYAAEARHIHASVLVTVNYGTGTPALAGAYLGRIHAEHAPVTEVEIGNEPYGCGSPDIQITKAPVSDTSYEPNVAARCPYTQAGSGSAGMKWFAKSYLAHAPAFIEAVRKNDPSVKVVLPYAISAPGDSGRIWNAMIMSALKGKYQGINVLWYPGKSASNPSIQTALSYLTQIPARAAAIKADIRKYAPREFWMIGEENVSNQPTTLVCQPVIAVFAAGSALAWLAQGASNVNWWTASTGNNRNGRCGNPDFAMFDLTGHPQPAYTGFLLASKLARPHAVLTIVRTGNSDVLAYHATLRNGHEAEAFINISASHSERVTGPAIGSATLTRLQYRSAHPTILTAKVSYSAVKTIDLPADSVTVFQR
jgi:hypothetical protein